MDIDSCYQVGYVIKRHGLKGDVKIQLASSLPKQMESVFVEIDNRLIPFFIENISVLHDKAIIKFEEVDSPEKANQLTKCGIFLPNSYKRKTKSDKLETKDLIGFSVYFKSQNLGTVSSINDHALNPLFVVKGEAREVLIPISEYFIKQIDRKLKKIKVDLPDGFIEI